MHQAARSSAGTHAMTGLGPPVGGIPAARQTRRNSVKQNSYLITKMDGTSEEILADHYEREEDEWVFLIGTTEVRRVSIDAIASITKVARGI